MTSKSRMTATSFRTQTQKPRANENINLTAAQRFRPVYTIATEETT